ncbi:MAG: UvrD-helicase domain-containing protein [Pseudomonadota bacterium]
MTVFSDASLAQIRAAQPGRSAWVAANAGSGKTRVLTDRVARLLLEGTPPDRILCLTFTKAAASEMQNRLYARLGEWAMLPDAELTTTLNQLGEDAVSYDLSHARTLFAAAVETPGGLKIQTIHAFCERVLKQFPLEANLPAQFTTLDERAAAELHQDVLNTFAKGSNAGVLSEFLQLFARDDMAQLIPGLLEAPDKITKLAEADDLPHPPYPLITQTDKELLAGLRPALAEGGPNDQRAVVKLERLLSAETQEAEIARATALLLTGDGAKMPFGPNTFPTLKVLPKDDARRDTLNALKDRVAAARDAYAASINRKREKCLGRFAETFLRDLSAEKARRGVVEFSDLIARTRTLLTKGEMAAWVLFKLDGGIDHILVDEAQDTSQAQWDIIEALCDDFLSGGDVETTRTLFVVGDEKQSIYSFQGASPDAFGAMEGTFNDRLEQIGHSLFRQSLAYSFRSSQAVLDLVDTVFNGPGSSGVRGPVEHVAFERSKPGRVDLWPFYEAADEPEDEPWYNPVDQPRAGDPRLLLARDIAAEVGRLLGGGTALQGPNGPKPISPGDILILIQSRGVLFNGLIDALKAEHVPVAGADRLKLSSSLAVQDILSLLRFIALAEDDLSLAEVLRSPLCDVSERDLFHLAHYRSGSLWETLRKSDKHQDTVRFLQDMRNRADFMRPYELIERCLTDHGGRARFLSRLGLEVEDALNELLAQALVFEHTSIPELGAFLHWFDAGDVEIKRDLNSDQNEVRVMTVHGAKGLEAPIVILPDTGPQKTRGRDSLRRTPDNEIIWPAPHPLRHRPHFDDLKHGAEKEREERLRLLYVAMTRAENWLIVAGAGRRPKSRDHPCWFDVISEGFASFHSELLSGGKARITSGEWPTSAERGEISSSNKLETPDWIDESARPFKPRQNPISPSSLPGSKTIEGTEADPGAVDRGVAVHRLLENLPDHPVHAWPDVSRVLLEDIDNHDGLLDHVAKILTSKDFGPLIASGLREVPFCAQLRERDVEGTFDLVHFSDDAIEIIDYKSNAKPPSNASEIPLGILNQMALYWHAGTQIFPGMRIRIRILWTETPKLIDVPEPLLTQTLDNISIA